MAKTSNETIAVYGFRENITEKLKNSENFLYVIFYLKLILILSSVYETKTSQMNMIFT